MARSLSAGFGRSAFETARPLSAHPGKCICRTANRFNPQECIDHIVIFGERHLRHVLLSYMNYYNATRTHLSLNKDAGPSRVEWPGIWSAARFWATAPQYGRM